MSINMISSITAGSATEGWGSRVHLVAGVTSKVQNGQHSMPPFVLYIFLFT